MAALRRLLASRFRLQTHPFLSSNALSPIRNRAPSCCTSFSNSSSAKGRGRRDGTGAAIVRPVRKRRGGGVAPQRDTESVQHDWRKDLVAIRSVEMKTPTEIEASVERIVALSPKPIKPVRAQTLLLHQCLDDLEQIQTPTQGAVTTKQLVEEYIGDAEHVFTPSSLLRSGSAKPLSEETEVALARANRVLDYFHEHGDPIKSHYTRMMTAYVRVGRLSDALDVYRKLIDNFIEPDTTVLNLLMEAFLKGKQIPEGLSIFNAMVHQKKSQRRRRRPKPDEHTYRIMVKYLTSTGNPKDLETAKKLVLSEEAAQMDQESMGTHVYSRLLAAYAYKNDKDQVQELLQDMDNREIPKSSSIFHAMIGPLCLENNVEKVLQLLDEMKEAGIAANKLTATFVFENLKKNYEHECKRLDAETDPAKIVKAVFDELSMFRPIVSLVRILDKLAENFIGLEAGVFILTWILDTTATEIKRGKRLSPSVNKTADLEQLGFYCFNACVKHGLKINFTKLRLGLNFLKTAEGVLLVLEAALWELKKHDQSSIGRSGLTAYVSRESIPLFVQMALSKFKPPLQVVIRENDNNFIVTKSSLRKWVMRNANSGWLVKDNAKSNQLDLTFFHK